MHSKVAEEHSTSSDELGLELGELEEQQQPFLSSYADNSNNHIQSESHRIQRFFHVLTVVCLCSAATFFVAGLWREPSDKDCVRKLNAWSPMLDAIEYHTVDFIPLSESPYFGAPTDELEQAWDADWQYGAMGIPVEHLTLLNKTVTERAWHHVPAELGGGIQAMFEGFHYIHCLNLVRQYNYRFERDYSYIHAFVNQHIKIQEHIEHCLEMLRVKITCEADTTLYPALLGSDTDILISMPDQHKCRNFGKMVDWAVDHITMPFDPWVNA